MNDGYCLAKTKKRMLFVVYGLLAVLAAVGMGLYGSTLLAEDRTYWGQQDYIKLAIGFIGVALFAVGGIYMIVTGARDALFPAKSKLAVSIRGQLPHPEEAPDVTKLFDMVDQDLKENGKKFEGVVIGKEWMVGEEANYIPRIRVVSWRHDVNVRNGHTAHTIQLLIMDDRRQTHVTDLRNPNELKAAVDCLRLRAPAAVFQEYGGFSAYKSMGEQEWANLERGFQQRKAQLEQQKR